MQAADEDEIRARLAGDPWASAGLLRIGRIEPWLLWLDSRTGNPARSYHPSSALAGLQWRLAACARPMRTPGRAASGGRKDARQPHEGTGNVSVTCSGRACQRSGTRD
jgi:hypothetical protein